MAAILLRKLHDKVHALAYYSVIVSMQNNNNRSRMFIVLVVNHQASLLN